MPDERVSVSQVQAAGTLTFPGRETPFEAIEAFRASPALGGEAYAPALEEAVLEVSEVVLRKMSAFRLVCLVLA